MQNGSSGFNFVVQNVALDLEGKSRHDGAEMPIKSPAGASAETSSVLDGTISALEDKCASIQNVIYMFEDARLQFQRAKESL